MGVGLGLFPPTAAYWEESVAFKMLSARGLMLPTPLKSGLWWDCSVNVGLIQNLLRCHWKSSRALDGAVTFCRSAFPASAVLQNGSSAMGLAGSISLLLQHSDCIESYLGWLKV